MLDSTQKRWIVFFKQPGHARMENNQKQKLKLNFQLILIYQHSELKGLVGGLCHFNTTDLQ